MEALHFPAPDLIFTEHTFKCPKHKHTYLRELQSVCGVRVG